MLAGNTPRPLLEPWELTPPNLPFSYVLLFSFRPPDLVNIFKLFIPQLLSYPNPTDPLNGEAAALLMRDPKAYENRIRECVRLHASDPVHLDGTPVAVVPPTPPTNTNATTNANTTATGGSASSSSSGGGGAAAAAASSTSGSGSDESDVSSSSDEQPAVSSANVADGANGNNNNAAVTKKEAGDDDATMGEAPAAAAGSPGDKRRVAAPGNNDAADGGASSSRSSSGSDFMMEVRHRESTRRRHNRSVTNVLVLTLFASPANLVSIWPDWSGGEHGIGGHVVESFTNGAHFPVITNSR